MTTLIIARHGNTFGKGDTPTRVGARTDLPLVEKGFMQGRALGEALKQQGLIPDEVYVSTLQRTQQTAKEALSAMNITRDLTVTPMLDEVDYGPDENQTEETVIKRIGAQAIQDWDEHAIVPDGWIVDPEAMIQGWLDFAAQVQGQDKTILVVTSNGTARFAPHITGDFDAVKQRFTLKLSTGAYGILKDDEAVTWRMVDWNVRPKI